MDKVRRNEDCSWMAEERAKGRRFVSGWLYIYVPCSPHFAVHCILWLVWLQSTMNPKPSTMNPWPRLSRRWTQMWNTFANPNLSDSEGGSTPDVQGNNKNNACATEPMPFPQDKKWGLSCLDVLWLWKSLNTTTYLDLNRCWLGVVDVARIYKLTLASLILAQTAGFQEGALWDRDNYGDRCSRAICQYNYARCANKSYKHIQMGPKKPLFWWGFDCTHEMRIIAGTDESGISVCAYVIPDLRIVDLILCPILDGKSALRQSLQMKYGKFGFQAFPAIYYKHLQTHSVAVLGRGLSDPCCSVVPPLPR